MSFVLRYLWRPKGHLKGGLDLLGSSDHRKVDAPPPPPQPGGSELPKAASKNIKCITNIIFAYDSIGIVDASRCCRMMAEIV